MLIRNSNTFRNWILFFDAFVCSICIFLIHLSRFGINPNSFEVTYGTTVLQISYLFIDLISIPLWILFLTAFRTRQDHILGIGTAEYSLVAKATVVFFASEALAMYFFNASFSRYYFFVGMPLGVMLLVISRWVLRKQLRKIRASGLLTKPTVIVGTSSDVDELFRRIKSHPAAGLQPIGKIYYQTLTDQTSNFSHSESTETFPTVIFRDDAQIVELVSSFRAEVVIFADQGNITPTKLKHLIWELDSGGFGVILAPGIVDVTPQRIQMYPISSSMLLKIDFSGLSKIQKLVKRTIDISASLVGLLLTSPIFLVCSIAIKIEDSGPIFYKQIRIGLSGKPFTIFKFRSMNTTFQVVPPLAKSNQVALANDVLFKMKDDPRVTKVGKVIRKWSIDELPQLVNILIGNMSLVGPRPPLPNEVEKYDSHVFRKFYVKPGLTGLWQVSGRSNLSWYDSVQIDLYYVDNWSLAGDFSILIQTIKVVLKREGAY